MFLFLHENEREKERENYNFYNDSKNSFFFILFSDKYQYNRRVIVKLE